MSEVRLGATATITITVRTKAGALVDADTLAIEVKDPNDAITTYDKSDTTRLSTGVYELNVPIPKTASPGTWAVNAEPTGAAVGSRTTRFLVKDKWAP